MKITIIDCPEGEEEEILIKCKQTDEQILKMVYALKAGREKLTAFKDGGILQVDPKSIYYFEAVENKTFLYLDKEVYETKSKLYELEERFQGTDFFRVSKSTILNLAKVSRLNPALGGRFEALMKNGEKLIISRQYVPALKEKLGL
ncbi:MAG: LytTR family transcriptional regulator DNA-binding domain-containing protein [Lachnospiraceae bacterium]|nr:LytTR family transcriptional regulator DNA-binding domain-containing protein [Lachnospiraceae bacterium]